MLQRYDEQEGLALVITNAEGSRSRSVQAMSPRS